MPTRPAFTALALVVALTGCATTYPASNYGATQRAPAPLVEVPRISGSSRGDSPQARAATTIGNRDTPARVRITTRASGNGVEVSPVIQSRYLNWRF